MDGSSKSSSSSPKRRRGARSVSGCLTCRRRRVKCANEKIPCGNCQRLNLRCTASFHANFKNWNPITGVSVPFDVPTPTSNEGTSFDANSKRPKSGGIDAVHAVQSKSVAPEELPQDWPPNGIDNGNFELQSRPALTKECIIERHEEGSNLEDHQLLLDADWTFPTPDDTPLTYSDLVSSHTSLISFNEDLLTQFGTLDEVAFQASSINTDMMWGISKPMPQVYGNSHGDMPLLNDYESKMPSLMTSKSSPWNPYNYMLNSTRGSPLSPLRHGILSWTCSYLSCRQRDPSYSGVLYYASASNAVNDIIIELSNRSSSGFLVGQNTKTFEKLYMLLSTTFFLSHCDMMLCNYQALHDRFESIKELFERHWYELKSSLSSLDCRLLTWLAYIDLRCSLFGNQKYRGIGSPKKQNNLLSILVNLNAFPSLRSLTNGRSYLSDCYGDGYPKQELDGDLLQEPCHMKCDDILYVLSNINSFETWNENHPAIHGGDSMIEELRKAKIQTLQADISRIRAECTILFNAPYPSKKDVVDRTTFHALTVIALHRSAAIMLNRILNPDIRTNPESQEAASEIIRIAFRLRKAKYLDTPRSLIWPLPLFIAGIETTDEIYQDWILSYMTELKHWGNNVVKAIDLLEGIIAKQNADERRVRVRDAMDSLKESIII